ncbi:hypothetical protein DL96DRAFT_1552644 [Flagelloscypha sp. PMI_526]|nr:hypothetical protein DL96DRAFT_1552644 [Flagelloscypha sp. PMI_526]
MSFNDQWGVQGGQHMQNALRSGGLGGQQFTNLMQGQQPPRPGSQPQQAFGMGNGFFDTQTQQQQQPTHPQQSQARSMFAGQQGQQRQLELLTMAHQNQQNGPQQRPQQHQSPMPMHRQGSPACHAANGMSQPMIGGPQDFSQLPPQQQIRFAQGKAAMLKNTIDTRTRELEALRIQYAGRPTNADPVYRQKEAEIINAIQEHTNAMNRFLGLIKQICDRNNIPLHNPAAPGGDLTNSQSLSLPKPFMGSPNMAPRTVPSPQPMQNMPPRMPPTFQPQHPNGLPGAQQQGQPQQQPPQQQQQHAMHDPQIPPGPKPPLTRERFDQTWHNYCNKNNLTINPLILKIQDRPIDMYQLHVEAMKEGGEPSISQRELWPDIGARMGFGSPSYWQGSPSYRSPAQTYLHPIPQLLRPPLHEEPCHQRRRSSWCSTRHHPIYPPHLLRLNLNRLRLNPLSPAPGPTNNMSVLGIGNVPPQRMAEIMAACHLPVSALQSKFPPDIVKFIDANRTTLQQRRTEQAQFRSSLTNRVSVPTPPNPSAAATNPSNNPMVPNPMLLNRPGSAGPPQPGPFVGGPWGSNQPTPSDPANNPALNPAQAAAAAMSMGGRPSIPTAPDTPMMTPPNIQGLMHPTLVGTRYATAAQVNSSPSIDVPMSDRSMFKSVLDQLSGMGMQMMSKGAIFAYIFSSQEMKIPKDMHDDHQQQLLVSGQNRYLVQLNRLQGFGTEMSILLRQFQTSFGAWVARANPSVNQAPNPNPMPQGPGMPQPPPQQTVPQPQQSLPPQPIQQPPDQKPDMSQVMLNQPPINLQLPQRKKQGGSPAAGNAASPPSTNTHKSPKPPPAKVAPMAKKLPRRNTKGAPTPPADAPTPSGSTPSKKRPREDESGSGDSASSPVVIHDEPSPPKKFKADPPAVDSASVASAVQPPAVPVAGPSQIAPPSDPMPGFATAMSIPESFFGTPANQTIETEEDANRFLQDMARGVLNGGESMDVMRVFDGLLKSYSIPPELGLSSIGFSDPAASGSASSAGGSTSDISAAGASANSSAGGPSSSAMDDTLIEFFDFSSFGTDAANTPAPTAAAETPTATKPPPTPELSNSTNPSPASSIESAGKAMDKDKEDESDPLRLGIFKEVDGGISAYWNGNATSEWRWDGLVGNGSSTSGEATPWAIST